MNNKKRFYSLSLAQDGFLCDWETAVCVKDWRPSVDCFTVLRKYKYKVQGEPDRAHKICIMQDKYHNFYPPYCFVATEKEFNEYFIKVDDA